MIDTPHIVRAESQEELERFCTLPGLSALTPAIVRNSRADEHWMLEAAGSVLARCSLWWSNAPALPGHRSGTIGHYAACDADAAARLLQFACVELAKQGCTLAIGPMDGSTNRRYRLLTERGTEPPFFLEPDNPDDWPAHFTGSGFTPLANYYSALQTDLDQADQRFPALAERFAAEGIKIRSFDAEHFEDEVGSIYRVVAASFRNNFLASPISEEEFLEQHRPLQPYVLPELVLLAEHAGEPVGFVFAIPDWLQARRGAAVDTLIVQTLAVHPAYSNRGLATLLTGHLREATVGLGYTRVIHALMHEKNISRHMSQTNQGQIMRRYTLYGKSLEGCV
jgi:GNAT superfamily N-acetyltransferase